VLVIGGAGFVGTHLTAELARGGFEVTVFDKLEGVKMHEDNRGDSKSLSISFLKGDILDRNAIDQALRDSEYVIHLAAVPDVGLSSKDPVATFRVNCEGTMNVLEAARRTDPQRLVVASSFRIYKDPPVKVPLPEDHPISPPTPYGVSKAFQDLMAKSYHVSYGLPIIILRMSPVFGPGQRHGAMFHFIERALKGEPLEISGGRQSRDWNYVSNCVHAYLLALSKGLVGEAYNIGSGKEISVEDLATKVIAAVGSASPIVRTPYKPGEGPKSRFCLDIRKAREEFGYEPNVDFEEGLKSTVDWARSRSSS